jgi:DNA replication protein
MKTFSGFPDGELKMSALPEMFYTGLLPLIDDLLEMKVTIACFRLCWQKSGLVRWTTSAELMRDPALSDVSEQIGNGVLMAVRRGSIVEAADRSGLRYFFPNSELGQAAAAAIKRGEKIESIPQIVGRPNIFVLYEQNIGALTPLIVEELEDAAKEFPPQWIEYAFAEAVKQNARSWAYVKKILDNKARGDWARCCRRLAASHPKRSARVTPRAPLAPRRRSLSAKSAATSAGSAPTCR